VPRGLLRVSVPPIQDGSFRAMLLEFVKTWPEVDLEVISTTLHQDLLNGHIDVAIRAGSTIDQGLIARRFAESMMYALASPDYLERAGSPKNAGELIDHQCIVGFTRGERPQTHWPLLAGGQVRVASHISSNDLTLLMAAAIEGQGIAFLPDAFVAEAFAAGTLVRVLPESVGALTQVFNG